MMTVKMLFTLSVYVVCAVIVVACMTTPTIDRDTISPEEELVVGYMTEVVNNQNVDQIGNYIAPDLIQHNPNLPNGLEPLQDFWTQLFADLPDANFRIVRVIADDDLVVVHSHFTPVPDALGMAVVDIFRVEDGLIVEHWDVAAEIPAETASGNSVVD